MNMKKSIAGVMAGAMAVSAMAATVSADQDAISLTYDLKTYINNVNGKAAKVTVVANYENVEIPADAVKDHFIRFGADNGYVVGGTIHNFKGTKIGAAISMENTSDFGMTDFEFTARPYKDLVTDNQKKYQTYKATDNAGNVEGALFDKNNLGGAVYDMPLTNSGRGGFFKIDDYDVFNLGYCAGYKKLDNAGNVISTGTEAYRNTGLAAAMPTGAGKLYAFQDAVAKCTYKIPNVVYLNKADGWGWNFGWKNEDELNNVLDYLYGYGTYGNTTMTADVFASGFFNYRGDKRTMVTNASVIGGYKKDIEDNDGKYKYTMHYNDEDFNQVVCATESHALPAPTTTGVAGFEAGEESESIYPLKSTLNPGKKTVEMKDAKAPTATVTKIEIPDNDVIAALQNRKKGGNHYTKPVAVINDAIANHDNVVFTFTSYDGYVGTPKSKAVHQWVNVDQGYGYETSGMGYDWHNPTFGQHLYTNLSEAYSLYDTNEYDMYGSYSSAWGINLFTGAVVVNNGITMQLNDTAKFDWGNNTLSFDWFDIIDDGKITDAKTFLTSMLLYTPVDWYWDSLTVVVSDSEDESVDSQAGVEGDEEEIEEEEIEEVVEEVVEEPVVEEVVEEAPVEKAPSPATGNAPVALAVIPVALAAAAVVAKKRG